jgi:hypothetical protein
VTRPWGSTCGRVVPNRRFTSARISAWVEHVAGTGRGMARVGAGQPLDHVGARRRRRSRPCRRACPAAAARPLVPELVGMPWITTVGGRAAPPPSPAASHGDLGQQLVLVAREIDERREQELLRAPRSPRAARARPRRECARAPRAGRR